MLNVSLHAGFVEGPFFYVTGKHRGTNHFIDSAQEFLGLSDGLTKDLTDWDDEYQSYYNPDVPQDSGFPSVEIERAWVERGRELAARIKRESPMDITVHYQANGSMERGECVF
ncbi:hypothetical protein UA75_29940 [Actinoalloteichus sp. GBA129-24]|uniref:Uncharacterized protein n=1 Tax=Actinoalloteichus fjordicus TaxID=1612552 RepID=A0AAC9LJG9_9PSEU|nr:hypothetical protein UA74_29410 [Actinoalloteichus fjordicus]APU23952.1 hypothetical protein UA75_29940 [Actinoalloteichus sp. GBA129-24]